MMALLVMGLGSMLAAQRYPGGFDWVYTVASSLASQKHNPSGNAWFAGALIVAMLLLWPYVTALKNRFSPLLSAARFAIYIMRIGLISGALMGLEKLLIHDLSAWIYKAHEVLGVLAFFGFYIGIICLLVLAMFRQRIYVFPVFLAVVPILAIGITQFWLYLDQRDLGWVDVSWREMGIPFWLSFAFWQWLAIGFLWMGLCLLSFISIENNKT